MNTTLAYLRGRRAWLVENLAVWGADCEARFDLAVAETVGSDTRLGFWSFSFGGRQQEVTFSSLTDSRGNNLPALIQKAAVVIIPRSSQGAFILAVNGQTGFSIARTDPDAAPARVDLLIFETGT